MLTIAENFAASQVLTEWPENMSYDELLTAISQQHPDVIVWEPHEDYMPDEVIDLIESLRAGFLNSVAEMTEDLRRAIKVGSPSIIGEELLSFEQRLGVEG